MNKCFSCGEMMRDDLDFCPNCKVQNFPYQSYIVVDVVSGKILLQGTLPEIVHGLVKHSDIKSKLDTGNYELVQIEVMELDIFTKQQIDEAMKMYQGKYDRN